MNKFLIYSFYRFVNLKNKKKVKLELESYILNMELKGTIIVANEGINGSISGNKSDLESTIYYLKKLLHIRKLDIKINEIDFLPFNRIKIRLKKEIVSLGKGKIDYKYKKNNFIDPSKWNSLIEQKNLVLIDLRNDYEIKIGKFKNAINPNTKNFREFPKKLLEMKLNKEDRIAMYCTGGIRCEKASNYLRKSGFKNINQLKGGILNYLEYSNKTKSKSRWRGECFVFDNRVTVNNRLKKGKYLQCHGCRHPITLKESKSKEYIKGVSCPKCYYVRSDEQKRNSMVRQKQINIAEQNKVSHSFKKIYSE